MGNLQQVFGQDGFDATRVAPAQDMGPVPSGEYAALIEDSGMQETNAKDGEFLECVHQICAGPFKGRKVWARLNLRNKSAVAKKIADSQFSAICHATGIMNPSDSAELHNIPMLIRVEHVDPTYHATKNPKGSKKPSNEIKSWKKLPDDFDPEAMQEAASVAAQAKAPQTAAGSAPSAPAAGTKATPAWKRKKTADAAAAADTREATTAENSAEALNE